MNEYSNEQLFAHRLSKFRTFLFWALAVVWFSETLFHGFQSLIKVWSYMWEVSLPGNLQLDTAQYITWALAAPVKGALFIMAIFGLRSKNPSARTALYVSMSLVPPLNLIFPIRYQGFHFGPTAVASTLSIILWGSFVLIRERSQQPEQKEAQLSLSRWEIFQYVWFVAGSAALTLIAFLFLFGTRNALNLIFPCLTDLLSTNSGELSGSTYCTMVAGTHILALAVGSWIAMVKCRNNQTLRQTMTIANIVLAALVFIFPLRQLVVEFGLNCAANSILIVFAPLLVGWLLYATVSYRLNAPKKQEAHT
jgi:hypothetical protein